jgi:hypothetical protein
LPWTSVSHQDHRRQVAAVGTQTSDVEIAILEVPEALVGYAAEAHRRWNDGALDRVVARADRAVAADPGTCSGVPLSSLTIRRGVENNGTDVRIGIDRMR